MATASQAPTILLMSMTDIVQLALLFGLGGMTSFVTIGALNPPIPCCQGISLATAYGDFTYRRSAPFPSIS